MTPPTEESEKERGKSEDQVHIALAGIQPEAVAAEMARRAPQGPREKSEERPLTEMEIELAREGHTYRNARWLATIDLMHAALADRDRLAEALDLIATMLPYPSSVGATAIARAAAATPQAPTEGAE